MKVEAISLEEKQISILNRIDSELKEHEFNQLKDKNICMDSRLPQKSVSSSTNNPLMEMNKYASSSSAIH